jgi:hypothetical protein
MTGRGFVVKAMTIKIDSVSYECEVTGLNEVESHDTQTSNTACANGSITDVGPSSFTIDVTANAVLALDSLYYLLTSPANYGKAAVLTYAPDATNHPTVTRSANVTLVPAGAQYQVGGFAVFDVSLPCTSPPTWATPPTADDATLADVEPEPATV